MFIVRPLNLPVVCLTAKTGAIWKMRHSLEVKDHFVAGRSWLDPL
jgi:hypothetical protein